MQTTRRSNLALAGRRFNHIFTDSYNKFSRLTVYEHITLGIPIKSLQFKLSLYMKYQMEPVTFMWFISTYLVPENNLYFEHSSKYAS